ncbi:MAG: AraC family transcriptional regulator [Sphingobacteriales bacterium]|nr:MAG: AraC family transcriptional regulator [Sphingobacteriales bacterium]
MKALSKNIHVSKVIDSVETAELIASRTILHPDGFNGFLHYHDNAHFSFVLKGGCAEKKISRYERRPGSITWYPAGELHQITAVKEPSYHVNFELPPVFFSSYDINASDIGEAIDHQPDVRSLMLKVYRELEHPDSDSILSLQQLLLNMVQRSVQLLHAGQPQWVKKIREYLQDEWNEAVDLALLSRVAGVHPVTISRYFPYYFSCTLGEYRRRLKINRAIKILLRSPEVNIAQLAFDCGFSDESHFIRVFRQHTNLLPAKLRRDIGKR